jgi:hypothetical protein
VSNFSNIGSHTARHRAATSRLQFLTELRLDERLIAPRALHTSLQVPQRARSEFRAHRGADHWVSHRSKPAGGVMIDLDLPPINWDAYDPPPPVVRRTTGVWSVSSHLRPRPAPLLRLGRGGRSVTAVHTHVRSGGWELEYLSAAQGFQFQCVGDA